MANNRLSKDEYLMIVAMATSLRSTCERRKVGAVLVKDGRIISTGYNGALAGYDNCPGVDTCKLKTAGCVYTVHAEANCITRAREQGDAIYCTDMPCINCLKMILSHNPKMKIVYLRPYNDETRDSYLKHLNEEQPIDISMIEYTEAITNGSQYIMELGLM